MFNARVGKSLLCRSSSSCAGIHGTLSCSGKISYLWSVELDSVNYPIDVLTTIRHV